MNPDRWREIRSIVEAAFDVPPEDRAAFLETACGADLDLRRDVEELLRRDERPDDAINPPSHENLWRRLTHAEVATGADLGDFVIEGELGAGGMGVVYAARQKSPPRRVALKMLRAGTTSPETLRRFRLESEVLARLQHPGIAQIYSTGTHEEEGCEVPWFAMELVEDARPVTIHAREQGLSLDQRLELFLRICDAVQLGHQKGVIHRDLKPGNVLVDEDGQPKIIDFGIARIVAEDHTLAAATSERTAAGVIGTLQSMSPEQAASDPDLDVRSDVYSLGVLLYELLTDATPHDFQEKAVHEIARTVVEDPPRSPRALAPTLPEDLEIVLLKALEKEKHRRYASARELAADLRRYRNHQPIEARRPSTVYQLTLFARRHRALVSASIVTVIAMASALVWSLDSTRKARAAEQSATDARLRAEDLFRRSLDVNMAFVGDFLGRVQQLPGSTQVSHDMLNLTTRNLEYLAESASDPGPARGALARALGRLGELQGSYYRPSLGDEDLAGHSFTRALEIARELHREAPRATEHLKLLARCQGDLGLWHLNRGELEEARRLLEAELDVLRRAATQLSGGDPGLRRSTANALQQLATVDGLQGNFEAALEHLDRARFLYWELFNESANDPKLAIFLAMTTGKCGMARFRLGDEGGIDDLLDECDMLEEILERDENHAQARWLLAETRLILCQFETERADLEMAREHGTEALAFLEELAEHEPAGVKYRRLTSVVSFQLGKVEEIAAGDEEDPEDAREHWLEAERWFERSLELTEQLDREGALPPQEKDHPRRIREHLERARERR